MDFESIKVSDPKMPEGYTVVKKQKTKKDDKAGIFTTNKLSYEIRSGLWAFLTQEYAQTQFGNSQSGAQVYGLGLQVFPRAHFEVNIFFAKEKINSFSSQFYDYGWVVGHFYL